MAGVELYTHHLALPAGGQRGAEAGGRLRQEGGHAAVQDAVGLVHLPGHGQAQDHPFGPGLDHFDIEELMNVMASTREESAVLGLRRRSWRHGLTLMGAWLG